MENADVLCLSLYVLLLFGLCIKTPLSSSLLAYCLLSSPNKPQNTHTHYDFSLCVFCMDFGKQGSWDSSSDEYEPQQQHHPKDDTDNDPTKRPYECTFCKRGFTNAQALGGHMNIHRKDRAKPKHPNFTHSSSSHSNDQFFPPLSTQPNAPYYPPPPSYRMYFDTAAANFPIHPQIRSPALVNQELLGANLSLQIDQTRGVWENEEVDLELRLGHEYR